MNHETKSRPRVLYVAAAALGLFALAFGCSDDDSGATCPAVALGTPIGQPPSIMTTGAGGSRSFGTSAPGTVREFLQVPTGGSAGAAGTTLGRIDPCVANPPVQNPIGTTGGTY